MLICYELGTYFLNRRQLHFNCTKYDFKTFCMVDHVLKLTTNIKVQFIFDTALTNLKIRRLRLNALYAYVLFNY